MILFIVIEPIVRLLHYCTYTDTYTYTYTYTSTYTVDFRNFVALFWAETLAH